MTAPRVWLAGCYDAAPEPADQPVVTDNRLRTWLPVAPGLYSTGGGPRRAPWGELRTRYDLVEVSARRLPAAIEWERGGEPESHAALTRLILGTGTRAVP